MRALTLSTLITLCACGAPSADEPIHSAVVCAAAGEAACPSVERAAAFDRWSKAAMRRPGSTFSVWTAASGQAASALFAACIPESWGKDVNAAKGKLLREGRHRAIGGGPSLPEGCVLPDATEGEVFVLGDGRRHGLRPAGAPLHVAVVCDRSNSMLGTACDAAALRGAYARWLERSGGAAGSTFTVEGAASSRDGVVRLFHVTASIGPAGERVAALVAARDRLDRSLAGAPNGSAIAEALSVAATDLQQAGGDRELLVLSDLRQVTRGSWNFEAAAPAPAIFTTWLRSRGLQPDLRGISVRVCGLHHRRAPGARPFDASLARKVVQAWSGALTAMGATEPRLEGDCPEEGAIGGKS